MRANLPVENAGSVPVCLFIEPYGEDFWLEPGEAATVSPVSNEVDVQFAVTHAAELLSVWLYEDGDPNRIVVDYQVTDATGTPLPCGHQRHDRRIPASDSSRAPCVPVPAGSEGQQRGITGNPAA